MREARFVTGEGSVSADREPSSGLAKFIIGRSSAPTRWRDHLLPQGEKGSDLQFGPNMNLPSPSRNGPVRI
jgi:hypothetical protein